MQISPMEEYSLRCLIRLARHPQGQPLAIRQISQSEGLSTAYVGKLLYQLQKNGLVQGVRGVQGGYTLTRPAAEMTLGYVFRAMNPTAWSGVCQKYKGDLEQCANAGSCGLQPVWGRLAVHIYAYLDGITLDDLAKDRPLPEPAMPPALRVAAAQA